MGRQRRTPEQIIWRLREAEVRLTQEQATADVARTLGITKQRYSANAAHSQETKTTTLSKRIAENEEYDRQREPCRRKAMFLQHHYSDVQSRGHDSQMFG